MARTAQKLTSGGWSGPDRRKLARVTLRKPVTIRLLNNGETQYSGICENASADGMLLFIEQEIPQHSRLEILLALPAPERKEQIRLCCSAKVVRVMPGTQDFSWGIAVEFFERSISWSHHNL